MDNEGLSSWVNRAQCDTARLYLVKKKEKKTVKLRYRFRVRLHRLLLGHRDKVFHHIS
jgi:hypothetical protein